MKLQIYETRHEMGRGAARAIAECLSECLSRQAEVRIVCAAAPSQSDMLEELRCCPGIDWSRVTAFHMDEYIGLKPNAPQSFGQWLRTHLFDQVPLRRYHLIEPGTNAKAECERYTKLLAERPIDAVLLGIGENGHLAFNDPPANLKDPVPVRIVELDHACRQQQVNDGCFPQFSDVPTHAITLTVPTLMSSAKLFCCVPGERKAEAVQRMMAEPISGDCPATALRVHSDCTVYMDTQAALHLSKNSK